MGGFSSPDDSVATDTNGGSGSGDHSSTSADDSDTTNTSSWSAPSIESPAANKAQAARNTRAKVLCARLGLEQR